MKYGVCCIVLDLENNDPPKKFKKITYSNFSKMPKEQAIKTLSERILNNIDVTFEAIKYCNNNNLCYRLSSDLFPLITYDKANVKLEELPDYGKIKDLFGQIKTYLHNNPIRISCHPSPFNVLASKNINAVEKTIKELNFYSWFMDQIGCPADHNSPMNLHVHNKDGSHEEIIDRFLENFNKLDPNCRARLTIENDDKLNCWSVVQLIEKFHPKTKIPICFDFLHHRCYPDGIEEKDAFLSCVETWGDIKPLFHYSESREGKNPRAHADYPSNVFNTYDCDVDVDFEFKMKDKAINHFIDSIIKKITENQTGSCVVVE